MLEFRFSCWGMNLWCLGLGVQGVFGLWGLGCRVKVLGLWGLGFRVMGLRLGV